MSDTTQSTGRAPRGARPRATTYDVAKLAGVSQTTVSFVLNGTPNARISAATRERVWDAIHKLGYRPNAAAQGLRRGGSRMIGFVTDAIATTPFAGAIIRGAQDAAWSVGNILLVVNTDMNPGMEDDAVGVMLEHRVRGIVYSTWYHQAVSPPHDMREVPTILVNCFTPDHSLQSVVPDEEQGGRLATEILLKKGHRRIGFINSVPISNEARERLDAAGVRRPDAGHSPATTARVSGYRAALSAQGIAVSDELVVEAEPEQEGGYEAGLRLLALEPRPTAIFAYNDRVAMGVYAAATEFGLVIPRELAVIGFDNQEVIAAHLRPPLSSIALPHYEMGWWGVNALLSGRAPGPSDGQHRIACPYVERSSV
jgi:LacI family transcriptional regulator